MGLGEVTQKVIPKPVIVSAGDDPHSITSRYFTPRRCHTSHAATGAIGVATAFALPGTVACDGSGDGSTGNAAGRPSGPHDIAVLHPQGRIAVQVELGTDDGQVVVTQASLVRTVRKILQGELHLPDYVFSDAGPAAAGDRAATAARRPFPHRPLTIIVPTSAGGANDAIARAVARRL